MKLYQKIISIVTYLLLFAVGIYIFRSDTLLEALNADDGLLIAVASYFKDADTWSLIFFALTFGIGFGLFIGISYTLDKLFKKLGKRFPKIDFINTWEADILLQIPAAFILLLVLFVIGSNFYVTVAGYRLSTTSIEDVPPNSPVFILGTSKYLRSGGENLYYSYRMQAAEELWRAGKVKMFILSGDGVGEGHTEAYDETKDMRDDLLAMGVPEDKIEIDRFGFNTQQSILRLRGVFRLNNIVIVSQDFHNLRAVVLCDFYGIESLGYNAKGSATGAMRRKEMLISRPRIIVDMLYANMQPQVSYDGEFAYREEFSATKSNKHVLIILLMIVLFVVGFVGYGTYRAKVGEERRKVAIRLTSFTTSVTLVLGVLVYITYRTLDIRFIDEIVETTASVVGVETKKMEAKRRAVTKLTHKPEEHEPSMLMVEELPDEGVEPEEMELAMDAQIESPSLDEDEPDVDSAAVSTTVESTEKIATVVPVQEPIDEDPFNTAEGDAWDSPDAWSSTANQSTGAAREKTYFRALVHDSQEVRHDGTIRLRLADPLNINGTSYPKNYVFEGKTIVFDGRIIVQVDRIGTIAMKMKNYDGGDEGMPILAKYRGRRGEIVLGEGEVLTLAYQ